MPYGEACKVNEGQHTPGAGVLHITERAQRSAPLRATEKRARLRTQRRRGKLMLGWLIVGRQLELND
jgi:hypothetical protein